jgi:hypothetical protein
VDKYWKNEASSKKLCALRPSDAKPAMVARSWNTIASCKVEANRPQKLPAKETRTGDSIFIDEGIMGT